jgi:hypothetical protein
MRAKIRSCTNVALVSPQEGLWDWALSFHDPALAPPLIDPFTDPDEPLPPLDAACLELPDPDFFDSSIARLDSRDGSVQQLPDDARFQAVVRSQPALCLGFLRALGRAGSAKLALRLFRHLFPTLRALHARALAAGVAQHSQPHGLPDRHVYLACAGALDGLLHGHACETTEYSGPAGEAKAAPVAADPRAASLTPAARQAQRVRGEVRVACAHAAPRRLWPSPTPCSPPRVRALPRPRAIDPSPSSTALRPALPRGAVGARAAPPP